jgi:hypothetical protein
MNLAHAKRVLARFGLPDALERRTRTFDPKCSTLAASVLSDHPGLDTQRDQDLLAAEIQQAINNWIGERTSAE